MKKIDKLTWFALLAGLLPWIYTLFFTGWFTADKSNLSQAHGGLLFMLQLGISGLVLLGGEWWKRR